MANHKPQSFYSLRTNFKYRVILLPVTIVVFLGVWKLVGFLGIAPAKCLLVPSALVAVLLDKLVNPKPGGATLIQNLVSSIQVPFVGFLTAIVIGIPLGLLMEFYEPFDWFVKPISEMIRPIPFIAWVPLTIVTLGIGFEAKVFIICFAAFVPCAMNTYTSIKLISPALIQVARARGASNFQILFKVCIPLSVQMVFAGVQTALPASWSTLAAVEMLASSPGLGCMMQMGRLPARPDLIVLGILIIDIIGSLSSALLTVLEQSLTKWRVIRRQIRKTFSIM